MGIDIGNKPDIIASAAYLPLRSKCFDGVFMFDVLERVEDIDRVLQECRRTLKVEGKMLIVSPNTLGFGFYDSFADPTHTHHFTWYTVKKILLRNGFKITDTVPLHLHITWPLRRIIKRVLQAVQQSICIVCERL